MDVNIHRFLPYTTVEGPGKRACLWVQGCPIRCEGCGVPWTWSQKGGTKISVENLFQKILDSKLKYDIEGVTFLGGEPFEQAEALYELAKRVRKIGLSVMTFSGYYLETIEQSTRKGWHLLLSVTDLLVDGPFVQSKLDVSRPWIGSSNQRYHFLTSRYSHLKNKLSTIPNRIEIRLEPNGNISINGLAKQETLHNLIKNIAIRKGITDKV
jgi:anaerobic ribonucleoside-triphosphate reductase activating protein